MKYSFVFVLASLALQCSCRPQGLPESEVPAVPEIPSTAAPPASSSPAAETIMTDVETPTEVSNSGDQVVFDETPASGSSGDDEPTGVTTDAPVRSAEEMQSEDAQTTVAPEMIMEEGADIINTNGPPSDDAPPAPSSDSDAEIGTTQAPEASS